MDKKRRHIILINKGFQFRLIAKFIILNILIMILFGLFLYIFLNSELDTNLQSAHVTYKNIKDMLFPIILTLSVLNILVSSIIIGLFVLYASHKLAGPLYRFNTALSDIVNKNLVTVASIREGDELYECSNTLNQVIKLLINDISASKKLIHEIKTLSRKGNQKAALEKKMQELEDIIKEYQI